MSTLTASPPARAAASATATLTLIGAAQFMVVADDTIVNVALPSIRDDLGFSPTGLAWVVNAYLLAFGGFLLLGGRAADLIGRRRVFMAGAALFTLVSLACGLAPDTATLTGARALQGLAGALLSPAALSILMATFPEGPERTKALGAWGGIMGVAGASGVLLGGVITDLLDWRWIFLINVPIGIAILLSAARHVNVPDEAQGGTMDTPGALLVTGGLLATLYTLVETHTHGWTSARTLLGFALGAVLLAAFVAREATTPAPLLPLAVFRRRAASTALVLLLLGAAALFAMFFFVTLYMQAVKGWSPLRAGVSWLPFSAGLLITSGLLLKLLPGRPLRPILAVGALIAAAGFVLLTGADAGTSYVSGLMPAQVVLGVGVGVLLVPTTAAATSGLEPRFQGLGAGLVTTFQQFGGAVGIAVLVTIADDRTRGLARSGEPALEATVGGFQTAFWVAAGLCTAAALVALVLGPLRAPKEITVA